MNPDVIQIALYAIVPAVLGLVGWVWALWRDHGQLKVKVAEEYVRHHNLDEIKSDLRSLRDLVYRIATKLEVPVTTEPYR
jgi:hypothetical protein